MRCCTSNRLRRLASDAPTACQDRFQRPVTARFDEFAARKTAEALKAKLEPWKTDLDRPRDDQIAIGSPWTRSIVDGNFYVCAPGDLPSTSLVFVESREGNTVAKNPSALGGGETDKHVIYEGLSRVAADAVM